MNTYPSFNPGSSAGVFSASPSGLNFVSSSTGEIDLATSSPGTYNITNYIAASGSCDSSVANYTITINEKAILIPGTNDTICAGASANVTVTLSGSATNVFWI